MKLKFKCRDSELNAIEQFFFTQEYDEKPEFDEIEIISGNNVFTYTTKQEFGHWYIIV